MKRAICGIVSGHYMKSCFIYDGFCTPTEQGVHYEVAITRGGVFVAALEGDLTEQVGGFEFTDLVEAKTRLFIETQLLNQKHDRRK
jgi:hypothetical protein